MVHDWRSSEKFGRFVPALLLARDEPGARAFDGGHELGEWKHLGEHILQLVDHVNGASGAESVPASSLRLCDLRARESCI